MRGIINKHNQNGFTLVEVMIAAAIFIILALFISTMIFNATTHQGRIEKRADRAAFVQNLALELKLKPMPTSSP